MVTESSEDAGTSISTDTEAITTDKAALDEADFTFASGDSATSVTQDFTLPLSGASGTTITWSSNDGAVTISGDTATVSRPALGSGDALVTLTATIAKGTDSDTKVFNLTVIVTEKDEFKITQFGITWYFDKAYPIGQFANGDYWVVGPVTIVGIDPLSIVVDGRTINGSMVNPSPKSGAIQGYDSGMYGEYGPHWDAALNVARPNNMDLSDTNPLVVQPHSSLVSSESDLTLDYSGSIVQHVEKMVILTVLESVPREGSFRPPYSGTDKSEKYNIDTLDYRKLSRLTPVKDTPGLSEVEDNFKMPWIDHLPGWLTQLGHPKQNMPNYGREMASQIGVAALMLHLDFTNEEKKTLLIRYVQLGIDLYCIIQDGGENNYIPNGGHMQGRKWPIIFAGIMLNDDNMKNITQITDVTDSGYIHFQEDDQTFYVTQAEINMTASEAWKPDERNGPAEPYTTTDLGLAEWGIEYSTEPERDNKAWSAIYREVNAIAWSGFVLAAHIMNVKTIWNHDALFDYQDRYMSVMEGLKNRSYSNFAENMWDIYRKNYSPTSKY